jgi:tRNA (cytidine/uridine-2'-O-)-methyltransferase
VRLIVFTTRSRRPYLEHAFQRGDVLLFGRETSGVPEKVHAAADARLLIPMREGLRSLNLAMAAAMAVAEAIRQTQARASGES